MRIRALALCLAATVLAPVCTGAATVTAKIIDRAGRPAADAVVTLMPLSNQTLSSRAPERSVIDQRHETFLPLVVVVRKGGQVTFTNNDITKHQVYSFSQIKQFQFVIGQGETSPPVQFDQAGVAAIGCNIHDQMIAYVFVSSAPFAGTTNKEGEATFPSVPDGQYRVALWHPQIHGTNSLPSGTMAVAGATTSWTGTLPLSLESASRMSHMHSDY